MVSPRPPPVNVENRGLEIHDLGSWEIHKTRNFELQGGSGGSRQVMNRRLFFALTGTPVGGPFPKQKKRFVEIVCVALHPWMIRHEPFREANVTELNKAND